MVIILGLITVTLLAVLNAIPLTFFGMLFLGNLGADLGFLELLPGALAVYCLKNTIFTYNK